MSKTKPLTIAQQAGYTVRKLKNRGIKTLKDHWGREVPVDYVPAIDLLKHFAALEMIEEAKQIAQRLARFKFMVQQQGDELYEQLMSENEIRGESVGGFTLATFDKTFKVLFKMDSVQEKIPEELKIAEKHWEDFMQERFGDKLEENAWLLDMVDELLHNTKKEVDLRQIGKLNRMRSKIKNKHYNKFLTHLNQAFDTRHTKRYEMFQTKNNQGEYDSIILTYASLEPEDPENGGTS